MNKWRQLCRLPRVAWTTAREKTVFKVEMKSIMISPYCTSWNGQEIESQHIYDPGTSNEISLMCFKKLLQRHCQHQGWDHTIYLILGILQYHLRDLRMLSVSFLVTESSLINFWTTEMTYGSYWPSSHTRVRHIQEFLMTCGCCICSPSKTWNVKLDLWWCKSQNHLNQLQAGIAHQELNYSWDNLASFMSLGCCYRLGPWQEGLNRISSSMQSGCIKEYRHVT